MTPVGSGPVYIQLLVRKPLHDIPYVLRPGVAVSASSKGCVPCTGLILAVPDGGVTKTPAKPAKPAAAAAAPASALQVPAAAASRGRVSPVPVRSSAAVHTTPPRALAPIARPKPTGTSPAGKQAATAGQDDEEDDFAGVDMSDVRMRRMAEYKMQFNRSDGSAADGRTQTLTHKVVTRPEPGVVMLQKFTVLAKGAVTQAEMESLMEQLKSKHISH